MKRLIPLFLIFMTSAASAEVSSSEVASALEARYGPLASNTSLSVSVNSVSPYTGQKKVQEKGLPDKFLAVVWDKKTNRFAALVEDEHGAPTRIAGNAYIETKIPVLRDSLNIGDLISRSDIEYLPMHASSIPNNVVQNINELLGKEVVRSISIGKPIASDSIAAPTVVKRNQEVQIIFKKGGLELTSKGKSLSNAAVGEPVKISRKEAARIIEGVAVSDGVVSVNSGE